MLVESGPVNAPRLRPGVWFRAGFCPAASQTRIWAPLQWGSTHRDHARARRDKRSFDRVIEAKVFVSSASKDTPACATRACLFGGL